MKECWLVVRVKTLDQKMRSASVDGKSPPKTWSAKLILLPDAPSLLVRISPPLTDTKITCGMLACPRDLVQ